MGYYMCIEESVLKVKEENFDKFVKDFVSLPDTEAWKLGYRGDIAYYKMDEFEQEWRQRKTTQDIFHNYFWEFDHYEKSENDIYLSINDIKITASHNFFLSSLAPFVENGSYINVVGEDSAKWRYEFRDGKVYELQGETTYHNPEEISLVSIEEEVKQRREFVEKLTKQMIAS